MPIQIQLSMVGGQIVTWRHLDGLCAFGPMVILFPTFFVLNPLKVWVLCMNMCVNVYSTLHGIESAEYC